MPVSIALRTKNIHAESANKVSIRACVGSGLLCLSLLTGCAGTSQQSESTEAPANITIDNDNNQKANAVESSSSDTQQSQGAVAENTADATINNTNPQEANEALSSNTPDSMPTQVNSPVSDVVANNTPDTVASVQAIAAQGTTDNPAVNEVANDTSAKPLATIPEIAGIEVPKEPVGRTNKNLGKHYGIWTLKKADGGKCKLSTPSLQTGNKEYSTQIWMDVEEQRVVVNASMALDIAHSGTGIKIDDQKLHPLNKSKFSTRAIVKGDLTKELAEGNTLHVFINGEEVGKKVLKRDVKLTNMKAAVNALTHCES